MINNNLSIYIWLYSRYPGPIKPGSAISYCLLPCPAIFLCLRLVPATMPDAPAGTGDDEGAAATAAAAAPTAAAAAASTSSWRKGEEPWTGGEGCTAGTRRRKIHAYLIEFF